MKYFGYNSTDDGSCSCVDIGNAHVLLFWLWGTLFSILALGYTLLSTLTFDYSYPINETDGQTCKELSQY